MIGIVMDRDNLFEILNEWNYWFRDLPDTFRREYYEDEISKKSSTGEVIVIKRII